MTSTSATRVVPRNRDAIAGREAADEREIYRNVVADARSAWLERHGVPFTLAAGQPVADTHAVAALSSTAQREAFVVLAADYFVPHAFPRGTDLTEVFPALCTVPGFAELVADADRRPPQLIVAGNDLVQRTAAEVAAEVWDRFENPVRWVLAADTPAEALSRLGVFDTRSHWLCQWFDRRSGGLAGTPVGGQVAGVDAALWMWANLDADVEQLVEAWAAMPLPLRLLLGKATMCQLCDHSAVKDAVLRLRAQHDADDGS